jgi:hypothetical protein
MYKFLYYFIYKGQLKDNKGAIGPSRYAATMLVTIAFFFHISFLYGLAKFLAWRYLTIDISFSTGTTYSVKLLVAALAILPVFIVVYRYFSLDKIQIISVYYAARQKKTYSVINFIKFCLIYLIPLLGFIYFVNHSIPRDY